MAFEPQRGTAAVAERGLGCLSGRAFGRGERLADALDVAGSNRSGEQAVMADAVEAARQHVQFVNHPASIKTGLSPTLGVEGLLKADDASRFEIAPEQRAHDRCMIIDDVQSAILDR